MEKRWINSMFLGDGIIPNGDNIMPETAVVFKCCSHFEFSWASDSCHLVVCEHAKSRYASGVVSSTNFLVSNRVVCFVNAPSLVCLVALLLDSCSGLTAV